MVEKITGDSTRTLDSRELAGSAFGAVRMMVCYWMVEGGFVNDL